MSNSEDVDDKHIDPLMMDLFDKLPASGSRWPLDERMLWLSACEAVINLLYGPADRVTVPAFLDQSKSDEWSFFDKVLQPETLEVLNETTDDKLSFAAAVPEKCLPPLKPVATVEKEMPKSSRPLGLPTNGEMATEAIVALGGKASAPQIRSWLRKKYWESMPDHWTACLYSLGLARDGINFTLSKSAAQKADAAAVDVLKTKPGVVKALVERESVRAPAPGKKLGPPAKGPYTATFTHGDRECVLQSSREYVLAGKLLKAMGKGHISEGFLADAVMSSNTEHNRDLVRGLCLGMNDALASVGLKVEFYAGFGLMMKEVDVG